MVYGAGWSAEIDASGVRVCRNKWNVDLCVQIVDGTIYVCWSFSKMDPQRWDEVWDVLYDVCDMLGIP